MREIAALFFNSKQRLKDKHVINFLVKKKLIRVFGQREIIKIKDCGKSVLITYK